LNCATRFKGSSASLVMTGRRNDSEGRLAGKIIFCSPSGKRMSQVTVGENEGIESALRRFKRSVAKAGIFSDLRRIRHHETPVEKYKRKLKQRSRNRRR
jgi:small subunit ribosomal protein S21